MQNGLPIGIAPSRSFSGSWLDMVEVCVRDGFVAVEFKYELPFILPDRFVGEMLTEIEKLGKAEKLAFSLHGPYSNIGALLDSRWQGAVAEQLEALEIAERLGAATYTVHCGWVEKKYASSELVAECRNRVGRALRQMQASCDNVEICLENQNSAEEGKINCAVTVPDLHEMADLSNGLVGFTFDIGHANVLGVDPIDFFLALGPDRVCVGHLHDNRGSEDDHLPLGQGNIDWKAFLKEYLKRGCTFPLLLELSTEEDFRCGKTLLDGLWAEAASRSFQPKSGAQLGG